MKQPKPTKHSYIVFNQLCKLIPVGMVRNSASEYGVDKKCRTFLACSHVVSLLYAQLTHSIGLNDVCDELVTNASSGVTFRLIKYQCPQTDTQYEFISNQMTIRPGVLAWLYMRRWDIEKTYDTFKNKMNEQRAWAKSMNAKTMQAQFLCLAHNLMVLLQNSISQRQGISDDKEIARAKKRCDAAMGKCREHGTQISPLYLNPRKRSQFSLKFIRWLRYQLTSNSLF